MSTAELDELRAMLAALYGGRRDTEAGAEVDAQLWTRTAELGVPWVGIDERAGGAGGSLIHAAVVAEALGAHAVALPVVETHLAAWLLASIGKQWPVGACLAVGDPWRPVPAADLASPIEHDDVAWGRDAAALAYLAERGGQLGVAVVAASNLEFTTGTDLACQHRDVVRHAGSAVQWIPTSLGLEAVRARYALLRAAQLAGAMRTAFDLTSEYTRNRYQFGRPIGDFPAVWQHLVQLAEAAALTELAVEQAANSAAPTDAFAAKVVANQYAAEAARRAHQAHGAIGMTEEYPLHRYTRRLQAWQAEAGTHPQLTPYLADALGAGAHAVIDFITGQEATV